MANFCDNTSAGVLIWNDKDELLLIERKKHNPGFACPAGHTDGEDPKVAARREIEEEAGLSLKSLEKILEITLENPCLGRGGSYHTWHVFASSDWEGKIIPADEEVKSYRWETKDGLEKLARRLEEYAEANGHTFENLKELVVATNKDENWIKDPGLEPPWYVILKKMNVF